MSIPHCYASNIFLYIPFLSKKWIFNDNESEGSKVLFLSCDRISIEFNNVERFKYCEFDKFFGLKCPIDYLHKKLIFLHFIHNFSIYEKFRDWFVHIPCSSSDLRRQRSFKWLARYCAQGSFIKTGLNRAPFPSKAYTNYVWLPR